MIFKLQKLISLSVNNITSIQEHVLRQQYYIVYFAAKSFPLKYNEKENAYSNEYEIMNFSKNTNVT